MKALQILCFTVLLAGCSNPPRGTCDPACREGEVCDPDTRLCFAKRNTGPNANPGVGPSAELVPVTLQVTEPAQAGRVNTQSLTVKGTFDDPSGRVTAILLSFADGPTTPATIDGNGFSGVVPIDAADFGAGIVNVAATGPTLQEPVTATVNVTVDNRAPACVLQIPGEGGELGPVSLLRGTFQDQDSQIAAQFFVDGEPVSTSIDGDGRVNATFNAAPNQNGTAVHVELHVKDSSGNECIAERTARVDTVAPVVTLNPIPAADGGYINLANRTFHVSGTVTDDAPAGTVSLTLQPWNTVVSALVVDGGFDADVIGPLIDDTAASLVVTALDQAGNSGTASQSFHVDTIAPVLNVTSPAQNQTFNAAQTPAHQVHVTFSATDAALQFQHSFQVKRNGVAWTNRGFPWCTAGTDCPINTSSDDPATYDFTIVVSDFAGNTTAGGGSYKVDNIAPTFTLYPPNGARGVDPQLVINFSEPVTLTGAAPYTASPNLGAFNGSLDASRTQYVGTSFGYGINYTATVQPQGADDFGNPLVDSQTSRFFTRVQAPANGAQLVSGSFDGFDAVADSDGVVTIGTWKRSPGASGEENLQLGFYRLTATGVALPINSTPVSETMTAGSTVMLSVNAWAKIDAAGNPTRVSSLRRTLNGSQARAMYQSGSGPLVNNGTASLYIPVQAAPGEVMPTSGDDVGAIVSGGAYSRPGNSVRFPSILPEAVTFGSPMRWQMFHFMTGSSGTVELWTQSFVCTSSSSCGFDASSLVGSNTKGPDVANLSATHLPGGRRITTWLALNGWTQVRCEGKRDDDPAPAPATTTSALQYKTRFAPMTSGNTALAAQVDFGGALRLFTADFSTCAAPQLNFIGAGPQIGVKDARPVQFGTRGGAVYLTSTGIYAEVL
ncbi:MAG: hypothetical protein ACJ790_22180 [Myxococcaceae bacterium]